MRMRWGWELERDKDELRISGRWDENDMGMRWGWDQNERMIIECSQLRSIKLHTVESLM